MNNAPVYALNLCNIKDREEYLTYIKRSVKEAPAHGGLTPRQVLDIVE
jgi:hypothetical protein